MVIFHSYVSHYQRITIFDFLLPSFTFQFPSLFLCFLQKLQLPSLFLDAPGFSFLRCLDQRAQRKRTPQPFISGYKKAINHPPVITIDSWYKLVKTISNWVVYDCYDCYTHSTRLSPAEMNTKQLKMTKHVGFTNMKALCIPIRWSLTTICKFSQLKLKPFFL